MITVFIGGSRKIYNLDQEVISRINNILDKSGTILVGDANGADKAVQKYLTQAGYENVIVFCAGEDCRNNLGNWEVKSIVSHSKRKDFSFFASKDKAMSDEADYGFMLWDGKSKGTINNAVNLLRNNKKVLVFHSKYKNFTLLSTMDDLRRLLKNCEDSIKEKLILDLNLTELNSELRQKDLRFA